MSEEELTKVFIEFLIEMRDRMHSVIKTNREIIDILDRLLKRNDLFDVFEKYLESHPEIIERIPLDKDVAFITDDRTASRQSDIKVLIDIRSLPPKICLPKLPIEENLKTFEKRISHLETVK